MLSGLSRNLNFGIVPPSCCCFLRRMVSLPAAVLPDPFSGLPISTGPRRMGHVHDRCQCVGVMSRQLDVENCHAACGTNITLGSESCLPLASRHPPRCPGAENSANSQVYHTLTRLTICHLPRSTVEPPIRASPSQPPLTDCSSASSDHRSHHPHTLTTLFAIVLPPPIVSPPPITQHCSVTWLRALALLRTLAPAFYCRTLPRLAH